VKFDVKCITAILKSYPSLNIDDSQSD